MKKLKRKDKGMKVYIVRETITHTTTTEYIIEAKDPSDAKARFRGEGQYNGDWEGGDEDGVFVVNP